jgi:hypothetical protein
VKNNVDMDKGDPRCAAIHEAGHAVVAQFYGLPVEEIAIDIGGGDAKGTTQIGPDAHLPIIDRTALCVAGVASQALFECPSRERWGMSDYVKVGMLVDGLPRSESVKVRAVGINEPTTFYEGARPR